MAGQFVYLCDVQSSRGNEGKAGNAFTKVCQHEGMWKLGQLFHPTEE